VIRLGVRLPLKRVFAATNAILLYLAFTFVGKGLYNLQEAGVFAPHPLPVVPDSMILRQLLGVYPMAETLVAQALFAAGVGTTYLYYRRRVARQATPRVSVSAPAPAPAATLHPAEG
jgi:high-affinity iron transporter